MGSTLPEGFLCQNSCDTCFFSPVFFWEFCKIFKNTNFFIEHLQRLLLSRSRSLKFVVTLRKCVGKISWLNVLGKFEIKLLPVITVFKEVNKICTNDYGNNDYLALKYIRFFTNDIIRRSECNVYQWVEKMAWKGSYNTNANSLVKQH